MNKTGIEYLDYTWNVTHGCSPTSDGCTHCWARDMSKRLAGMNVKGYDKSDPFKVVCCPDRLDEPLKKKKPSRIGVSFMGDLFHEDVPKEFIWKVFAKMVYWTPHHTYLVLTKRPERMASLLIPDDNWGRNVKNVWLGVSVEDQKTADERIPILLQIPAAKRFVSVEPMLDKVDLSFIKLHERTSETVPYALNVLEGTFFQPVFGGSSGDLEYKGSQKLDWVIIGCESGAFRKDFPWGKGYELLQQCRSAKVPVFFKQWRHSVTKKIVKMPKIDGKVYDQFPE